MQTASSPRAEPRLDPFAPRMLAIGFVYWLLFLLSLEPDNIARAMKMGASLQWPSEVGRIGAASLLGCAATPLLLEQARRFPVLGSGWRRNALIQALGCLAITGGLIIVSCLLAKAFLPSERRPLVLALKQEFVGNGPLVAFCVMAFVGFAHGFRRLENAQSHRSAARRDGSERYLGVVSIKARGCVRLISMADVDWIETQGNYLALHVEGQAHLIRTSLARFEAQLDPEAFIRVHRQTLVAKDRITTVSSLGAGDAQIMLKDGTSVRLSRTFRHRFEKALATSLEP